MVNCKGNRADIEQISLQLTVVDCMAECCAAQHECVIAVIGPLRASTDEKKRSSEEKDFSAGH